MKFRRTVATTAVIAAAALALAGCTGAGSNQDSETGEIQAGTSVTVAQNSAVTSLNSYTATGYATYNSNVQYLTQATFNYYDDKPDLVRNTDLGTYTKVSDKPLTIKYTINKGADWSDGQPITATDVILTWASYLTKYNDSKGVNFGGIGAGSGLDYVTQFPTISDDGRSVTFVFSKPYVDWEVAGIQPNIPAHILWEEAFPGKETGAKASAAVLNALKTGDTTTLKALATAFDTKWNVTSMPTDKKLLVASGAYTVSAFVKDQYITLTARKDYKNGPAPKIAKITFRFIPDQTAQVQALQNGEISVLYGQATSDTVAALKNVKDVKSVTAQEASFEHVDLSFKSGPFSPKTYGGDAAKALKVRQAFFTAVPRQEMLDRIIKPLAPDAKLMDSQLFIPGQKGYDGAAVTADYTKYQTADDAKAKQMLAAAGVKTPVTVRFAYPNDNPRRVQEFQIMQSSMKAAGFNLTDVGKPTAQYFDPSVGLGTAKYAYDASIFAYAESSFAVGSSLGNTQTGNAYNYIGYSDKDVDALWEKAQQQSSFDAAIPYMQQIDKHIIDNAAYMTLYEIPSVVAWSDKIQNVKDAPLVPNVFWNYFDWSIKGK
ncbi:ABC transporter family substrate-binding protein [Amnibacterium kyonggiense]